VDSPGERHMTGTSGISQARVQFAVYAVTAPSRELVGEALREAFDGISAAIDMGTGAIRTRVLSVSMDSRSNDFEPPTGKDESGTFVRRIDFLAWYEESIPSHG